MRDSRAIALGLLAALSIALASVGSASARGAAVCSAGETRTSPDTCTPVGRDALTANLGFWREQLIRIRSHRSHAVYPSPKLDVLRDRLDQTAERYGFRVVGIQMFNAGLRAPLVVVENTRDPLTLAKSAARIIHTLDPDRSDWVGFVFVVLDRHGHPYQVTWNAGHGTPGYGATGMWAARPYPTAYYPISYIPPGVDLPLCTKGHKSTQTQPCTPRYPHPRDVDPPCSDQIFRDRRGACAPKPPCANPAETTVTVEMRDDSLNLSQWTVPCGTVTFIEKNLGSVDHSFSIVAMPPGSLIPPGATEAVTVTLNRSISGSSYWAARTGLGFFATTGADSNGLARFPVQGDAGFYAAPGTRMSGTLTVTP